MRLDSQLHQRNGMWWPAADRGCWDWMQMAKDLPQQVMRHASRFRGAVVAGANAGFYIDQYAEQFEQVLAIEPEGLNFLALVQNCQQANVIKLQAALGCNRETVAMDIDHEGNCGGFFCQPGGVVPTVRLDDLPVPVDLLHLDVEGYELQALQGAEQTIAECRPVVVCENIGNESRYGQPSDAVPAWLKDKGYQVAERLPHDTIYVWRGAS